MKFELRQDTPKWLELFSTRWGSHGPDDKVVFFTVFQADQYVTTVSFTPDEARRFGKLLIDEAESIEGINKSSKK